MGLHSFHTTFFVWAAFFCYGLYRFGPSSFILANHAHSFQRIIHIFFEVSFFFFATQSCYDSFLSNEHVCS